MEIVKKEYVEIVLSDSWAIYG